MALLFLDQDGREYSFLPTTNKLKLQPIGEKDAYGNTLCAVVLQSDSAPAPVAIGVYQSTGFAEAVAREFLLACDEEKLFFQMPPASVSALDVLRRIEAAQLSDDNQ